jgi:hypothetical protein
MRQMIYAMQFTGHAAPVAGKTDVLKATTTASSCAIESRVGPGGLDTVLRPIDGGAAVFESEVTITGENSFLESGNIRFGNGHMFPFVTIGHGYIDSTADPELRHGTVTWKIEDGEGQFQGASGLITSNFTIDASGRVVDYHFGLLFVP